MIRPIRMSTNTSQAASRTGLRYQGVGSDSWSNGSCAAGCSPLGCSNPAWSTLGRMVVCALRSIGGGGGAVGGASPGGGYPLLPYSACRVGWLWKSSRGPLGATASMVLTPPAYLPTPVARLAAGMSQANSESAAGGLVGGCGAGCEMACGSEMRLPQVTRCCSRQSARTGLVVQAHRRRGVRRAQMTKSSTPEGNWARSLEVR
jgi:hypothetical protein